MNLRFSPPASTKTFQPLDFRSLAESRREIHQAAQLPSYLGRSYLGRGAEDPHGALSWDARDRMMVGQGKRFWAGLQPAEMVLTFFSEGPPKNLSLAGKTEEEALLWLRQQVEQAGGNPASLSSTKPYDIPETPQTEGRPFAYAHPENFRLLAQLYAYASHLLSQLRQQEARASEIRVWPHHFDLASQITLKGSGEDPASIGVGLSPGDEHYDQPYFYVTPWPAPPQKHLPPLPVGSWRTEGWTGAILTYKNVLELPSQGEGIADYLKTSLEGSYHLLS